MYEYGATSAQILQYLVPEKKKNYIRSSSDTDIRLTFKDQPRHSIVVVRVGEIVNEVAVHVYVGDGFSSICNL